MDTSIFLHTLRYTFVIIIYLRIFWSVKRQDRTLMGRFRPNFSPKLEPIHRTIYKHEKAASPDKWWDIVATGCCIV